MGQKGTGTLGVGEEFQKRKWLEKRLQENPSQRKSVPQGSPSLLYQMGAPYISKPVLSCIFSFVFLWWQMCKWSNLEPCYKIPLFLRLQISTAGNNVCLLRCYVCLLPLLRHGQALFLGLVLRCTVFSLHWKESHAVADTSGACVIAP